MAILVTGGAGYIGSHTVVELQNAGYDVVAVSYTHLDVYKRQVSLFPNAQMYYPAAGVMLAVLLTRRPKERVPVKFCTGFLLLTASLWAMCMLQVIFPAMNMLVPMNLVIIFGSLITWILLLLEKKETRRAAGLSWGKGKKTGTWLWVALFLALYLLRLFLNYALMRCV